MDKRLPTIEPGSQLLSSFCAEVSNAAAILLRVAIVIFRFPCSIWLTSLSFIFDASASSS